MSCWLVGRQIIDGSFGYCLCCDPQENWYAELLLTLSAQWRCLLHPMAESHVKETQWSVLHLALFGCCQGCNKVKVDKLSLSRSLMLEMAGSHRVINIGSYRDFVGEHLLGMLRGSFWNRLVSTSVAFPLLNRCWLAGREGDYPSRSKSNF